uniref:Thioesterase domain-containing protein n=1 Tax=Mycena chlorophos TaxID=658473 RepID=A0ABQ0LM05_MYCCL|nr:predicted protein [Mycena chlorophos]
MPTPAPPSPESESPSPLAKLLAGIPDVPASHILGNLPQAQKQQAANLFYFFIAGHGEAPNANPFAGEIGMRIRIVEMNVFDDVEAGAWQVMEVEVTPDMCNAFGTMHGACGAFLLGHAGMGTIVLLGNATGFDSASLASTAQNLQNLHWHTTANLGETLTIRARTVFVDRKNRGARLASCEIREIDSGRLILTGTVGGVPSMSKAKHVGPGTNTPASKL